MSIKHKTNIAPGNEELASTKALKTQEGNITLHL